MAGALVVVLGLGIYALLGTGGNRATRGVRAGANGALGSSTAELAPDGIFTTAAGTTTTIASLRGTPTMVWFVAGGCASCAASIPAVAAHLGQLTRRGLRVLTLGLSGDFSAGRAGVAQLLSFGRSAAGSNVERPGWLWGMASKLLSVAYDPSGTPDAYVLIGAGGHIRYRSSVPVSTMPEAARRGRFHRWPHQAAQGRRVAHVRAGSGTGAQGVVATLTHAAMEASCSATMDAPRSTRSLTLGSVVR